MTGDSLRSKLFPESSSRKLEKERKRSQTLAKQARPERTLRDSQCYVSFTLAYLDRCMLLAHALGSHDGPPANWEYYYFFLIDLTLKNSFFWFFLLFNFVSFFLIAQIPACEVHCPLQSYFHLSSFLQTKKNSQKPDEKAVARLHFTCEIVGSPTLHGICSVIKTWPALSWCIKMRATWHENVRCLETTIYRYRKHDTDTQKKGIDIKVWANDINV